MTQDPKFIFPINEDDFFNQCVLTKTDSGQFTKYDPKTHIRLIYKVFANFGGQQEFVQLANINSQTFYDWINKHSCFASAYKKAKELSFVQWEKLPLHDRELNMVYWNAIMRNRFNYGKPKVKKVDGKNPIETLDSTLEALKEGKASIKDASGIAEILEKRIDLENKVKEAMEKDTDKLSHVSDEKITKIQEILNGSGND